MKSSKSAWDRDHNETGINVVDIADLPTDHRKLINALLHDQRDDGLTLLQLQRLLPALSNVEAVVQELIGKSFIVQRRDHAGSVRYMVMLRPRRARGSSLLDKLFS